MVEVAELLAAATPLPWEDRGEYRHEDIFGCDLTGAGVRFTYGGGREGGEGSLSHGDAMLIVHAVNALPALVAALEQIHAEGKVCSLYEICEHVACQSSYAAWATADAALRRLRESVAEVATSA